MASICLDLAFFSRAHTPTIILPPSGPLHRLPRHIARSPFQLLPTTSAAVFDWGIALCVSPMFEITRCRAGCCCISLDTSRCRPWPVSGSLMLNGGVPALSFLMRHSCYVTISKNYPVYGMDLAITAEDMVCVVPCRTYIHTELVGIFAV